MARAITSCNRGICVRAFARSRSLELSHHPNSARGPRRFRGRKSSPRYRGQSIRLNLAGGTSGCGFIFELSPASSGSWTYSTLYNFTCSQGDHAGHTMVMDTSGNLYGVGQGGGVNDYGVAYELSPASGGGWTYTVLTISHWPKAAGLKSVWSPTPAAIFTAQTDTRSSSFLPTETAPGPRAPLTFLLPKRVLILSGTCHSTLPATSTAPIRRAASTKLAPPLS